MVISPNVPYKFGVLFMRSFFISIIFNPSGVDWPRQNGRFFADEIFTCILLNEKVWISINISLKFVPEGQINNIPVLVQIMAWCQPGNKPLPEPMMFSLLTHICVTRPQWVNCTQPQRNRFYFDLLSFWSSISQHCTHWFKRSDIPTEEFNYVYWT